MIDGGHVINSSSERNAKEKHWIHPFWSKFSVGICAYFIQTGVTGEIQIHMLSEWPHRKAVETPPMKAEGDRNTSGDHSHQQAIVSVFQLLELRH